MYIPFDNMPPQSRVWVYQSDRPLSSNEQKNSSNLLEGFIQNWAAHNQPLKGSFKFSYDHFLIITVDESFNQASGCSIDASVHFVKQLENELGLSFFDRGKVAFLNEEKVVLESISNLKMKVSEGAITERTMTFNNLVKNKEELQNEWIVPASQSWLKRYFRTVEQHEL